MILTRHRDSDLVTESNWDVACNALHENCIFYAHAGKHTFGWRKKLSAGEVSFVLDKISEFPFQYEILCDDGRTLEGNYRKA